MRCPLTSRKPLHYFQAFNFNVRIQFKKSRSQSVFIRPLSSTSSKTSPDEDASIDPRWLSTTKQRIGRCLTFGLSSEGLEEASQTTQELGKDWIELLAGSEGFLTGKGRFGLDRQEVAWGEMVGSLKI